VQLGRLRASILSALADGMERRSISRFQRHSWNMYDEQQRKVMARNLCTNSMTQRIKGYDCNGHFWSMIRPVFGLATFWLEGSKLKTTFSVQPPCEATSW